MNTYEMGTSMLAMADVLAEAFEGFGFALLIFDLNAPGIGNYLSNGSREDMIKALREAASRLENNEFIPTTEGNA